MKSAQKNKSASKKSKDTPKKDSRPSLTSILLDKHLRAQRQEGDRTS